MKKMRPQIQTAIIAILGTASLSAYLFLHSAGKSPDCCSEELTLPADLPPVEENLPEAEVRLPDVMLLKKAFEVGRRILPGG